MDTFIDQSGQTWTKKDIIKINAKKLLNERLNNLKISKQKQAKFLSLYAEHLNISKCARKLGVRREAINKTRKLDPAFDEACKELEKMVCDDLKETMVIVGNQSTRDGYNDRFRYLQAHDPAFAPKPEIQINQQFNINDPDIEIKQILNQVDAQQIAVKSSKNKD